MWLAWEGIVTDILSAYAAKYRSRGDPRFKEILDTLWEIHQRKAAEYGDEKDPLGNINEAKDWGVAPWANAMLHATDKIRSLKSYVKTGKEPEEGMADTFMDAANYVIIALLKWEDDQQKTAQG